MVNRLKCSKYKIMEASTFQRSKNLQEKIPDISKTLFMVEHLKDLRVSAEIERRSCKSIVRWLTLKVGAQIDRRQTRP